MDSRDYRFFSSPDMENEVISILMGSSLFSELEAEDRQELVNRLISLIDHSSRGNA